MQLQYSKFLDKAIEKIKDDLDKDEAGKQIDDTIDKLPF
jgi:hypothetical protein